MLRHTALAAALLTGLSLPAIAGDMPDFLNKKYATDPAACKGPIGDDNADALVLDKTGIAGLEFGCSYLDFWPGKDGAVTALVSCGDDSGITRPDLLSIIDNGNGEVRVQSQNEFVMGSVANSLTPPPAEEGKDETDNGEISFDYVSGTYALCGAAAKSQ